MTQILEIQGDEVVIKETVISRKIKLDKLIPHLVRKDPVTVPNLPRTAVFVHYDESQPNKKVLYLLCEVPASIKTIIKQNKIAGNKRRYRLAFPWTYFWFVCVAEGGRTNFTITNNKCLHSKEKYDGFPGEFYTAFLPNIYKDSADICYGTTAAPVGSIDKQIDTIVNNFYVTEFNDHLDTHDMVFPFGGNSFKNWVEATNEKGAMAFLDFPEWNTGVRKKFTMYDLIGMGVARTEKIVSDIVIPEIPMPMTFGRAEEWVKSLTPQNRGRLKVALANQIAEDPNFVEEPTAIDMGVADDGGIPV